MNSADIKQSQFENHHLIFALIELANLLAQIIGTLLGGKIKHITTDNKTSGQKEYPLKQITK